MSALPASLPTDGGPSVGIEELPLPALIVSGAEVRASNAAAAGIVEALAGDETSLARLALSVDAPSVVRLPTENGTLVLKAFCRAVEGGTLALLHDVTVERHLINAMAESRSRFTDFVRCSADFAWETDGDGRFAYVSPKGALGLEAGEIVGRLAIDFLNDAPAEIPSPFETRTACERESVELKTAGGIGMFEISSVPRYDDAGVWQGARGVCRDVTEVRRQEAALQRAQARLIEMARTDGLTGLLNRAAFVETLMERLAQYPVGQKVGVLLYVDLDRFKFVNDTYGHQAGDEVLRRTADILRRAVRDTDLVSRVGGDEFVLWLERMPPGEGPLKAEEIAAAVAGAAAGYPEAMGLFGASIGLTQTTAGEDPETLMARADAAMYGVKRAGRAPGRAGERG